MPVINATIVADSISPQGYRITTFETYYPRYILAEVNTHRIIARSSASSRAIPLAKRLEQVENDPYIPTVFGKNRPGMQALETVQESDNLRAREIWRAAAGDAARRARELAHLGVHKQQANRLLEPFVFVHTVMTATEWDNFFALRAHSEADPEFEILAARMRDLYERSSPVLLANGEWHTPYVKGDERTGNLITDLKVSAARCARVSYKTHDGAISTIDADLTLATRLLASKHLSPFDHQGVALDINALPPFDLVERQRHFVGWSPFRAFVEDQHDIKCRRFIRN